MWIVDNSVEVLKRVYECNRKEVTNIRTYDVSTLYTCIPHKMLRDKMGWVIKACFNKTSRQYIRIGKYSAVWHRSRGKSKNLSWDESELIDHMNYLIENIYVVCGDTLFDKLLEFQWELIAHPF